MSEERSQRGQAMYALITDLRFLEGELFMMAQKAYYPSSLIEWIFWSRPSKGMLLGARRALASLKAFRNLREGYAETGQVGEYDWQGSMEMDVMPKKWEEFLK